MGKKVRIITGDGRRVELRTHELLARHTVVNPLLGDGADTEAFCETIRSGKEG